MAHAEELQDLTKPEKAKLCAYATVNGKPASMAGKGTGSDGSKYPPENIFDDGWTVYDRLFAEYLRSRN